MSDKQLVMQRLRSFPKAKGGNFAIMTALCLPLLLGIGGAAIEVARAMQIKADLQSVADAAVISATTKARLALGKMKDSEMIAAANQFIAASSFAQEIPQEERKAFELSLKSAVSRNKTDKGEEFHVRTAIDYDMKLNALLSFLGQSTMKLSVESTAKSSFNNGAALSLYLVLDRSGSMSFVTDSKDTSRSHCINYTSANWGKNNIQQTSPCYVNKMSSLKLAVHYLADTLKTSDPTLSPTSAQTSKLIRTGAIAYNDAAFTGQSLTWGTAKSLAYVAEIPEYPSGGTSAVAALSQAVAALRKTNRQEEDTHKAAGNTSFERFIVFMTDGEMTGNSASWSPSIDASVREICTDAKKDGIVIFSIAFMAPSNGRSLLQSCASSSGHYYAPEKMGELVAAFGDIARKASSIISMLTN